MTLPTNVVSAAGGLAEFFALTAGDFGAQKGFNRNQGHGSINPDALFFGTLTLDQAEDNGTLLFVSFSPLVVPDTDGGGWRSLHITGTFAGGAGSVIYQRANRTTYFADNTQGGSQWQFTLDALGTMISANVYQCVFRR